MLFYTLVLICYLEDRGEALMGHCADFVSIVLLFTMTARKMSQMFLLLPHALILAPISSRSLFS